MEVVYSSSNNKQNKSFESICDNPACNKPGLKHCDRCNLVSYCSRECQKKDWKVHKKMCKKASSNSRATTEEQIHEEMQHMRLKPSLAKVAKFEKRCADQGFDFILTSDPHMDWGLGFENPLMQMVWPTWMEAVKDENEPSRETMLRNMLNMLYDASTRLKVGSQQCRLTKVQIHQQLESLYGSFDRYVSQEEQDEGAAAINQAQADMFQKLGPERAAEIVAAGILPPLEPTCPPAAPGGGAVHGFALGSRVRVRGLVGKPEHNGKEGEVLGAQGVERVQIRLADGVEIALKPSNLEAHGVHAELCDVD